MLDACSQWSKDILAVSIVVALLTIVASTYLLTILLRAAKRVRDRADLERRILSARGTGYERDRAAVLPRAPRGTRPAPP